MEASRITAEEATLGSITVSDDPQMSWHLSGYVAQDTVLKN
jgi:hypothetical protein